MSKTIEIQYYALLREKRGLNRETMTTEVKTVGDLYCYLKDKYSFNLPLDSVRVAINSEFSAWDKEFRSGDSIVFIPPVAGG